ncbi:auxin-responsive protein SAUR50-like [Salvia divinorum]|uniref:Auxin-responsive protein SAUR50-like n=1 Tax=Salvia divinorum TaxID=28513 RepID=A0ABD1GV48_SALDI
MDDDGESKATGIGQIVNLKKFLQKWQAATIGSKGGCSPPTHHGIPPAVTRRLRTSNSYAESDDDGCQSPDPPVDVPRGYLAVYVGPELRRFIIPTSYLRDPLFKVLLDKAEEEFGFDHSGGLTIPCEIETFKYLLQCMENHRKDQDDKDC